VIAPASANMRSTAVKKLDISTRTHHPARIFFRKWTLGYRMLDAGSCCRTSTRVTSCLGRPALWDFRLPHEKHRQLPIGRTMHPSRAPFVTIKRACVSTLSADCLTAWDSCRIAANGRTSCISGLQCMRFSRSLSPY
jgi:hypothetical protein